MAWRRPGDKPLCETMMVSLLMHICVTQPQWVNNSLIQVQGWWRKNVVLYDKGARQNGRRMERETGWVERMWQKKMNIPCDNVMIQNIFSYFWPFVRGIHWTPVDSFQKEPNDEEIFFIVSWNKLFKKKQSSCWWFGIPRCSCNITIICRKSYQVEVDHYYRGTGIQAQQHFSDDFPLTIQIFKEIPFCCDLVSEHMIVANLKNMQKQHCCHVLYIIL